MMRQERLTCPRALKLPRERKTMIRPRSLTSGCHAGCAATRSSLWCVWMMASLLPSTKRFWRYVCESGPGPKSSRTSCLSLSDELVLLRIFEVHAWAKGFSCLTLRWLLMTNTCRNTSSNGTTTASGGSFLQPVSSTSRPACLSRVDVVVT